MQSPLKSAVRQERTGWRDQSISARHRIWGFNCPAVDLDFLMVEYNLGLPVGLVEYKHFRAREPQVLHPTYRALGALADGYKEPLPFVIAFYWPDVWAFQTLPVNETAQRHFGFRELLTERAFVRRLYRIRRLVLAAHLEEQLNDSMPNELFRALLPACRQPTTQKQ